MESMELEKRIKASKTKANIDSPAALKAGVMLAPKAKQKAPKLC